MFMCDWIASITSVSKTIILNAFFKSYLYKFFVINNNYDGF